jgi:hypothetical protein
VGAPAPLRLRLRGAVALTAMLFAAVAHGAGPVRPAAPAIGDESHYQVAGHCRDGLPQGGYALRASDGRLRVQGAFSQGQRVGSFIFWNAAGVRIAHLPFDADALNGTLSLWYPRRNAADEPRRRIESTWRRGVRHGQGRSWYASGRRRAETEYSDGVLQSVRAWSEAGAALDQAGARAVAERDRAATDTDVDALTAIVRRHPPECAPPPAQQRADTRCHSLEVAEARKPSCPTEMHAMPRGTRAAQGPA